MAMLKSLAHGYPRPLHGGQRSANGRRSMAVVMTMADYDWLMAHSILP
jgi:hypothetical protein